MKVRRELEGKVGRLWSVVAHPIYVALWLFAALEQGGPMRLRLERLKLTFAGAIVLVVISLGLCAVQAGVWAKATAHAKSETLTQNKLGSHRPNEAAGLVGMLLLVHGTVY